MHMLLDPLPVGPLLRLYVCSDMELIMDLSTSSYVSFVCFFCLRLSLLCLSCSCLTFAIRCHLLLPPFDLVPAVTAASFRPRARCHCCLLSTSCPLSLLLLWTPNDFSLMMPCIQSLAGLILGLFFRFPPAFHSLTA